MNKIGADGMHKWLVLLCSVGCGGSLAAPSLDGGVPPDSGGPADATRLDAGLSTSCPGSPPANGTVCGSVGLQCEYGTAPRPACNTVAVCQGNRWQVTTAEPGLCPSSQACPTKPDGISFGQACGASFPAMCVYPLGVCSCDKPVPAADAGTEPRWTCDNPRAGCDSPAPHIGSQCSQFGMTCDYSICTTQVGVRLVCDRVLPSGDFVWQSHSFTCP